MIYCNNEVFYGDILYICSSLNRSEYGNTIEKHLIRPAKYDPECGLSQREPDISIKRRKIK